MLGAVSGGLLLLYDHATRFNSTEDPMDGLRLVIEPSDCAMFSSASAEAHWWMARNTLHRYTVSAKPDICRVVLCDPVPGEQGAEAISSSRHSCARSLQHAHCQPEVTCSHRLSMLRRRLMVVHVHVG